MELIKISQNADGQSVISARELYDFLGYEKAHWARWYPNNIINNPYAIENEDWVGFTLRVNGNRMQDFALSLDFAKRLAMRAQTDKGEQARRYFIECERKLKEKELYAFPPKSPSLETMQKAFIAANTLVEQLASLQAVFNDALENMSGTLGELGASASWDFERGEFTETETAESYMTVEGFLKSIGKEVPIDVVAWLVRRAKMISKHWGAMTGTFGTHTILFQRLILCKAWYTYKHTLWAQCPLKEKEQRRKDLAEAQTILEGGAR